MNVVTSLRRRKLGLSTNINTDFTIDRLQLQEAHCLKSELIDLDGEQGRAGPLACAKHEGILAVASEDGSINLLSMKEFRKIKQWIAHANAIFDLKWKPNDDKIITGSGDCSLALWDAESQKQISRFCKVHQCSIKTISFYDTNIFASGARDGHIKIHDLRIDKPTRIIIKHAHISHMPGQAKSKNKLYEKSNPLCSVLSVAFDTYVPRVYSSGVNDGTLKLWDLRQNKTINPKHSPGGLIQCDEPNHSIKYNTNSNCYKGFPHLIFSYGKLYASCTDNNIYCYDRFNHPNPQPIRYTGYKNNLYCKMAILEDKFLIAGSKSAGAQIWSLGNERCQPKSSKYYSHMTRSPIGQLNPDNNDSNDTTCVETDWNSLSVFTCRDDHVVCKWTMQHVADTQKEKLLVNPSLSSQESDVRIQMSDVVLLNVFTPSQQMNNREVNC